MCIVARARPTRASKRSPLAAIAAAWVVLTSLALAVQSGFSGEGHAAKRYYAHEAVEDEHGVIAPWTPAQNGPCDFRVRVAADYLRDDLLPKWCENPTLGYNYWDWHSPVSNNNVVWAVAHYLIEHCDCFPNWRTDARNVLLVMLN